MRFRYFSVLFLVFLAASALFVGTVLRKESAAKETEDVYVGVYAGATELGDLLAIADQVKSCTNLFVIGSTATTYNFTELNEVCQVLNGDGLNFMTFVHFNEDVPFAQWIDSAEQNWSRHFLGLYAYDEPGGNQIDHTQYMAVKEAENCTDAADKYVGNVTSWLDQLRDWCGRDLPMFTSDYGLYNFDYKAGYDGVFTEFGWNFSRPLQVALYRGAATANGKPWGAIITWKNNSPPYLESGQELYADMVYAYRNGAKYILFFDYDKNNISGYLQQEHLDALKQFWQYIKDNPSTSKPYESVAYVLPKDYGFGFRGATDKIWGLWEADNQSAKIWNDTANLTQEYGPKLDIIYEDGFNVNMTVYGKIIFWNGTTLSPHE
jgi:hypothetical protein